MAYVITDPSIGLPPIAVTDTTATAGLGKVVRAKDSTYGEGEFIYLLGVTGTEVGSVVTYNATTFQTALLTVTNGKNKGLPVAVAMSANVGSQYGWYQISGIAAVKAPNAMTVGADVFSLAATPGSVDDAAVNGEQILNAKVSTTTGTPSTGLALIEINRPFHQGQVV